MIVLVSMFVVIFTANQWISSRINNSKTIAPEGTKRFNQGNVAPANVGRLSPPVIDPENDPLAPMVKAVPPVPSLPHPEAQPQAVEKVNELPLMEKVLIQ